MKSILFTMLVLMCGSSAYADQFQVKGTAAVVAQDDVAEAKKQCSCICGSAPNDTLRYYEIAGDKSCTSLNGERCNARDGSPDEAGRCVESSIPVNPGRVAQPGETTF
jgi:hypothetical protein